MATGAQVSGRFDPVLGEGSWALERGFRELRADGLLPTGGRGGGKGSVHFEADHLASVMLSMAALQPSAAPAAVRSLDALPYRGSENLSEEMQQPAYHLGLALVEMIEGLGKPFSRGEELSSESLAYVQTWKLVLCLNPLSAQIMVGPDEERTTHFFAATPTPHPGLRRLTILSGDVLLAAGVLLADTIIQHNAIAAVQFLDRTKPIKASHENENAGDLCQKVPTSSPEQHRANDAELSDQHPCQRDTGRLPNRREPTRERKNSQGKAHKLVAPSLTRVE